MKKVAAFSVMFLLAGLALARSVESSSPEPRRKKTAAERYETSAARLVEEADRLAKRMPKLPEAQRASAETLQSAKRALAGLKMEAAALWRKHLGELPAEFKPKLREAQARHSAALKEFYRVGRELRAARRSSESATNFIAPASIFGK
jgi:hypothetical protein